MITIHGGLLLALTIVSWPAIAFELATHASLTEQAYMKSRLTTDPKLQEDLGLTNWQMSDPFGQEYYDVSESQAYKRTQNDFEKKAMPNKGVDFLTIKGWLMRGAIREDDLGYLRTWQGWLYLAVVIDLHSRKVVGWSMKPSLARELVLDALLMALWRRKPKQSVIVHSD